MFVKGFLNLFKSISTSATTCSNSAGLSTLGRLTGRQNGPIHNQFQFQLYKSRLVPQLTTTNTTTTTCCRSFHGGLIGQHQQNQKLLKADSGAGSLDEGGQQIGVISGLNHSQNRSLITWSFGNAKRKTVKAVVKRFYRLNWGAWIHPKMGRANHMWKKPLGVKKAMKHHIFASDKHSEMLDKMVCKYWKEKKYFVDDPYENYHTREDFPYTKGLGRKYTCIRNSRV